MWLVDRRDGTRREELTDGSVRVVKPPTNAIAAWARQNRKQYGSARSAAQEAQRRGIDLTKADLKEAEASGHVSEPKRDAFEAFYGPLPGVPVQDPLPALIEALQAQTTAMHDLTCVLERLLTEPDVPAESTKTGSGQ